VKAKPHIKDITNYRSFLVGLVGHVDSGKTAIVRQLTDIVSTAGLDAHPQSKERGITIDLGFTSFIEEHLLITLVDAPGHADLIRSVVASARIIDAAIVVIDAKEGIQVQTAEHMIILELLNITSVLFVINKIDVVSRERIQVFREQLVKLLQNTKFGTKCPIIEVSAKESIGIESLKHEIVKLAKNTLQLKIAPDFFWFPIDHHFQIKGVGVVVTGTTQGSFSLGDKLFVIPHQVEVKVKNAQVYHQNVPRVPHGFRAGMVLSGIEVNQLTRGDIVTSQPTRFEKVELCEIKYDFSQHFQKIVRFGSQINVSLGMVTTSARFFPFFYDNHHVRMLVEEVNFQKIAGWKKENIRYGAFLWFQESHYALLEELMVLSQLDVPPSTLRFFGSALIQSILPLDSNPEIFSIKTKTGFIKNPNYSETSILVSDLAQSKDGAKTLINKHVEPPFGKIINIFGGKGVVIVEKPDKLSCEVGDPVLLRIPRSMKIRKTTSYN